MSRRTAAVVAWTLVAVSVVLGFTGTGMKLAVGNVAGWHFVSNDVLAIILFLVSAVVGALVVSRLPANPIGWILLGLAVSMGISGGTDGYVALATDRGRLGGVTPWAAWYSAYSFIALFAAFFLTLLLFPDGHLLTRRWRVVFWAGALGLVLLGAAVLLKHGTIDGYRRFRNPIGVDSPILSALGPFGVAVYCAALVAAAVSLVLRFRRAEGVARQQLTVLVAAGVAATTTFVASWFIGASEDLDVAITLLGILAIPVGIGVAMLRYRLYEIDRVISKTLVYGALTVILGAAYVGLVLAGQAVFSSFAGGSNLAIAVSTLLVAALFLPLRSRVQRIVDRRFNRRRYDAQRTLDGFAGRLREQVDLETLQGDLRDVVHDTMEPAHVSLWLRSTGRA